MNENNKKKVHWFSCGFGIAFAFFVLPDGIAWLLPNWMFPHWLGWLHNFIVDGLIFLFIPAIIPALFAAFVYWRQERGALKKWTLVGVFFFHAIFSFIIFAALSLILGLFLWNRGGW